MGSMPPICPEYEIWRRIAIDWCSARRKRHPEEGDGDEWLRLGDVGRVK